MIELATTLLVLLALQVETSPSDLRSTRPADILDKLDLDGPGLEVARSAAKKQDTRAALGALRDHYRQRFPRVAAKGELDPKRRAAADRMVNHVYQWGPYEPFDYGPNMNWEADPRGDIEWVAALYRFYWATDLAEAYEATRDEKYARAFVELTTDWIQKHPLENYSKRHPVYKRWRGFAWLDIQTGIRANSLCHAVQVFVHSESFSPEFLGILLASLHDHQVKTERLPMNAIHNKAIFEQRGFINIAVTFPEFRDSQRWLEMAIGRTRETLVGQVTKDGVQREWTWGYHLAVLRDAADIVQWMESRKVPIPADYRERVRAMYDYVFFMATPELAGPMFGDAGRYGAHGQDRSQWPLYSPLMAASERFRDPKYAALARLDVAKLPKVGSHAFPEAGMYVMRNEWGPEQIYFAMHCSPRGISGHDQPDNGTFELRAFGRWLMPDTGYFTYGHDPASRAWHRRTAVHQTLTLDEADSKIDGRHLLWKQVPEGDVLTVENPSYENLIHRRTAWFVNRSFFVLLDEAIGDAEGSLDMHFQLAPGEIRRGTGPHTSQVTTCFDDANVLIQCEPRASLSIREEDGWHAWDYGKREPRKAVAFRHSDQAPAAFLTVLYPYRGTTPPEVTANMPVGHAVGADRVELAVRANGRTWHLGRDLQSKEAWCRPADSP